MVLTEPSALTVVVITILPGLQDETEMTTFPTRNPDRNLTTRLAMQGIGPDVDGIRTPENLQRPIGITTPLVMREIEPVVDGIRTQENLQRPIGITIPLVTVSPVVNGTQAVATRPALLNQVGKAIIPLGA